jgi:glycosyltransferase involved in cell wall biosynthesis
MNIAIITSEFITERNFDGGLANYNYKLAKSLVLLGHTPVIFVGSDKDEKMHYEDILIYRVNVTGYDAFLYKNRFLCKPYTKFKRFLKSKTSFVMSYELKYQSRLLNKKFRSVNGEIKFDIIHYSSLAAVGFFRPKNIPAISRISGSTIGSHYLGGYGDRDSVIHVQQNLEFKTLKKMDGIFGPSRMIANMITKEIKREIRIIETPFLFPKEELDQQLFIEHLKGKKYLLFFGSIGLIKGCATIAEIIEDFFKTYLDYYFVFIGKILHGPDGEKSMLNFLKKKAGNFADRIIHFDKTPHRQLFPIIQHSEFVVLPSRIDNFPNTCIEAMGVGKIVIGTKGNGFEQMIVDKENGILIEIDNSKQLLESINYLIHLPENEKINMERKAKERIEILKPEVIAKQLIEFYSGVIKDFR